MQIKIPHFGVGFFAFILTITIINVILKSQTKNDRRNIMKKIISILLIVTLAVMMSGCSLLAFVSDKPEAYPTSKSVDVPDTPTPVPTPEKEASIFSQMPDEFIFTSGAGAWSTEIELDDDGTFEGQFHDSEMGAIGEGYPNGSYYECEFEGKFSTPVKVSDHVYKMTLESLTLDEPEGKEYIKDGVKHICSGPYGIEDGKTFLIYLPGTHVSELPEGFLFWANVYTDYDNDRLPENFYGIYNVEADAGFGGFVDRL